MMEAAVMTPPVMFGRNEQSDGAEYGIREVAEMLDISLRAIRFYEQKGLLSPPRDGRFRVYRQPEIERLRIVQNFRKIGLTIREIKTLFGELHKASSDEKKIQVVNRYLERRLREIELDMSTLKDQEYQTICMMQSEQVEARVRQPA